MNDEKFQLLILSSSCIIICLTASAFLYKIYRKVQFLKRNILTLLDELYVYNYTFFVCLQCSICLFSLLTNQNLRNDHVYFVFYILLYGSLNIGFFVAICLSFCRVFIIHKVKIFEKFASNNVNVLFSLLPFTI